MKKQTKIILFLIFILLIVFLFLIQKCIKNTYCEGFLDTKYEKTICLVWRNKIQNDTHQGFGDKLRGAIFLYKYCKKKNINLKIDANHDVCGYFLKNVTLTNENGVVYMDKLMVDKTIYFSGSNPSPENGDLWWDFTSETMRFRTNNVSYCIDWT
jgi:hypothetical protein